jgi:hypothetical protein
MAKHTCKIIWTYFALQKVSKVNMRKQNLNESDAICNRSCQWMAGKTW